MKFGQQIELGFRTYFNAITFIFSNGLWWAFFFPVGFNLLLFAGGFALLGSFTDDIQAWVTDSLGITGGGSGLTEYLPGFIEVIIWVLINVLFFFVFAYLSGYITLLLLSPLFAYLSERTEEIISGKKYPFVFSRFLRDMLRGMLIALRNLALETAWIILLFILGFIPVIGWLGAILLFLISAYFYGFSFLDYTSERRGMNIGQSIDFVRRHKWLAVANGTFFCLLLLIPFLGILLSGFVAIVSVVAATLAVHQTDPVRK